MRLSLWAVGCAALIVSSAAAASDLLPTQKAPPPVQPVSWTGFHIGVNAGLGWSTNTDSVRGANLLTTEDWLYPGEIASPSLSQNGFIGGSQIGYDYEFAPSMVAGLAADLSGASLSGKGAAAGTYDSSRVMTGKSETNLFGTVRTRLGYAPTDRILAYATGGMAYGNVRLSTGLSRPSPGFTGCENGANNCERGSTSALKVGWTIGAGLEWALADAWSVNAEYLYYDLGKISHSMADSHWPGVVFEATEPLRGDIVRIGLNYRFGSP
jgi:outer membrane immunogenic protein